MDSEQYHFRFGMRCYIAFLLLIAWQTPTMTCQRCLGQTGIESKKPIASQNQSLGLFLVSVDGKKGFIDSTGSVIIKPQYDNAYRFQDGLAAVQIDGKWGYINQNGEVAIEPQFLMAGLFSDGLASIRKSSYYEPWQHIDQSGHIVIEEGFDCVAPFRKGVARVGNQDLLTKLAALADIPGECNYFYINKLGERIPVPAPTHYATGIENELILFSQDGRFGYVNASGETKIAPSFLAAGDFHDGLAWVRKDALSGFIDRSGRFAIPARFQYANDFSEGLAAVSLDGKWGLIDSDGEFVVKPQYDWIYGSLREGIIQVVQNKKSGYINRENKWVWEPTW